MGRRSGAQRVFIDVDDIAPGRGFAEAIHQAVAHASALLVLIGPGGNAIGGTRAIAWASQMTSCVVKLPPRCRRGCSSSPCCLMARGMPAAADLLADPRPLTGLQAVELGHGRFDADLDRLVAALKDTMLRSTAGKLRQRRRWALVGTGLLLAAAAGGWLLHAASARRAPPREGRG